jgi:pimeloyl-ACP methyl ester carboxylesterase
MDVLNEIYRGVPPAHRARLQAFRAAHPYQRRVLDGVRWEYVTGDARGAPALLILGGAMSTGESAFDLLTRLEDRYYVLAPSYPPLGRMGPLVDGLVALLDVQGIDRAHVFGHSLGAAIGHVLVRRHPERVDKLVLSSFGLYNHSTARRTRRALRLFRLLPYAFVRAFYRRRLSRLLAAADDPQQAFLVAYTREVLEVQHDKASLMGHFGLMEDLIENAAAYGVLEPVERSGRVLIIQAQDDSGFAPDEQAALRATYPGARVHLFDTGGHLVRTHHREAYDTLLSDFLAGS